ncbi:acetolactate synthase [Novosphingobium sp. SG707]|uniref:acetolactate synthase n=1 Tax=Novosphingobium sp. SG707 TaxID=2586996 RepID=UPI0018192011|nr:acetolactate synthase-1/2/3 large subunit [Novosphingobium sp. SG707]
MLIFAGSSPFTQQGEMLGSRNEFIQRIQYVHDQRGLVRGYMRYDNEIRTGANVKQVVHRAMQYAKSDPKGPVYLMAPREVLEAPCEPVSVDIHRWQPVTPPALAAQDVRFLAERLAAAKRPLIVTSYWGRNTAAVAALEVLCTQAGLGVVESVPSYVDLPHDSLFYLGNYWNNPEQNADLAAADLVLVVDSDVPWIPIKSKPSDSAEIYDIANDPLKEQMPLWYIEPHRSFRADAAQALQAIGEALAALAPDADALAEKTGHYAARGAARRARVAQEETQGPGLTTACPIAALRGQFDDQTIVMDEGITNYRPVFDHLATARAGSMFASGGGSLGWNAPRHSALAVHPDGYASKANDLDLSFSPAPDYGAIAAASGGAATFVVDHDSDLDAVLSQAFAVLTNEHRTVVVEARLG